MTRPVQWSREALDDLKQQLAYIAADNPVAARRVADLIRGAGAALGKMPTGRPGRVSGSYEKVVTGLPYIIAYSLTVQAGREFISIVRVIHTSRDWQPEEWPE
ncbi:type II toxin-antitoxin system RelE/ParE family toxin [Mesorhizobium sp. B2-4-15]|uniref:type II toxin-antitoxin system RelE/ParE family toxin n=1 Tax=Mesorhizobium sp. B2-4-15 TaxID=2589934 RepID=UPI00114F46CE|nr:type II toxin-antitoxin system RelE/ParE family toxin [Mesorhizobium sp. B2-4-15]TPK58027.1 type II toxin-antitoxin system RelE/ParE family toxin [Mesorhizobium sp. B2-4-15]